MPRDACHHVSALMVCRYWDDSICSGSLHLLCATTSLFVFGELAEHFVPSGSHVKHARVEV